MTNSNEVSQTKQPARTELFADPAAIPVWAALIALPEPSKHEVCDRLGDHLANAQGRGTPQRRRVAIAIAALREAQDLHAREHDTPLSVEGYKALRVENPDHGWPPDGSIRRWLGGSWNDALGQAGLEAVPEHDVTALPQGPAFLASECVEAVKQCAAALEHVPSINEYLAWARRRDVLRKPGRRPMSQGVFDRATTGYTNALRDAELIDGEGGKAAMTLRPSAYRYQPAQAKAALEACARTLRRSPRTSEYSSFRNERLAADPLTPVPSLAVIRRMGAGNWDDALVAAGLDALGGRGTRSNPRMEERPRKPRHTDEALKRYLNEAAQAVGDPFTGTAYDAWRKAQLAADRKAGRLPRTIPSYQVFWQRHGTWAQAKEKLLDAPPQRLPALEQVMEEGS